MASKVKALQAWCKAQADGYRDVEVRNMTSSWKSGLAFCAIIHRYRPDLIDYDSLRKEDVFQNNKLAFDVADRELNIPALLDAEDMEAMSVPDKLCIVTYVSQYYNYFRNKDKLGGPGIKGKTATKRSPDSHPVGTPEVKKAHTKDDPENWKPEPKPPSTNTASVRRGSSMGEMCTICREKVYLMERHIEDSKLYHRRCLREKQRSTLTRTSNQAKDLHKYSDVDHKKTTNQNGYGKENKKPDLLGQSPAASKTSSALFSKLHSAPKPYSGAFSNDQTNQSKTVTARSFSPVGANEKFSSGQSKVKNDKDSGIIKSTHLNGTANKTNSTFQDKGYFKSKAISDKQVTKTCVQQMETDDHSGKKYEIVGSLVNKFPDDSDNFSQPQIAVAKSKPFTSSTTTANLKTGPKGSAGDTQMLQGLLKTLQGVRQNPQPQKPLEKKADLTKSTESPSKVITNGFHHQPSMDSSSKEDPKTKLWSGSTFENKEDYTSTRNKLKHVGHTTGDTSPQSKDIHTAKVSHQEKTTEKSDESKSILKFHKDSGTSVSTGVKSQVKTILKQKSNELVENEHGKVPAKSILRFSHEANNDTRSRNKSPPKSILKHDHDDNDENSNSITRRKSISPTRSILKHVDDDNDSAKFRARSTSPQKSILKQAEHEHPGDPKSILKSKSEEDSDYPLAGKTILKKSQEFENSHESPKSILKKSHEDLSQKSDSSEKGKTTPDSKSWGDKFKGFLGISKDNKSPKTSLLNNVQLDSSDTEEPMEVDTKTTTPTSCQKPSQEAISPLSSSSQRPTPTPRKSILKKAEEKSPKVDGASRESKSWFTSVPKAEKSSHSPESSTVFSSNSKSSKTASNSAIDGNNFSAFNLNDSIDLINIRSLGDDLVISTNSNIKSSSTTSPKNRGPTPKSAWQIEMEARQGIRQKEPKVNLVGIAARMDAAQKQKHHQMQEQKELLNKQKPAGGDESSKRPAWQIEAEKRQLARNGEYQDPEKFPRSHVLPGKNTSPRSVDKPMQVSSSVPKHTTKQKLPPARPTSPPARPTSPPVRTGTGDKSMADRIKEQLGKKSPHNDSLSESKVAPDFINSEQDIFGRTSNINANKGLNRTPAFKISPENSPRSEAKSNKSKENSPRIPSDSDASGLAEWQKEAARRQKAVGDSGFIDPENKKVIVPKKKDLEDGGDTEPSQTTTKKKIIPDTRFSFNELNYNIDSHSEQKSPTPSPPSRPPWVGKGFRDRPLPSPPDVVPKRKVNAEPKMAAEHIMKELQTIDEDLRVMENKGRILEEQIRKGSDDDMDMDEDELMIKWFELVNQKNEFVRRESELMYKKKQQELEETHEDLEYELRRLMTTPEHEKTASDKVREDTLLQELLATVSQRNSIVDSMEEDRIRYIEEDQEIAEVMAQKDFAKSNENPPPKEPTKKEGDKKKKSKKEKKEKNKGKKNKANKINGNGDGEKKKKMKEKNKPSKPDSTFYEE